LPGWRDIAAGAKPLKARPEIRKSMRLSEVRAADPAPAPSVLDLHGMTLAEAHSSFLSFIDAVAASGLKTGLVITGRGDSARGTGAIRREFPSWCELLGARISSVAPRGEGAFAVRIGKSARGK
jgi:DNA-nicking Smr family endonuclease